MNELECGFCAVDPGNMVDEAKTRTIRAGRSRPQITATRHEKPKYTLQRHATERQRVEPPNHNQGSPILFLHGIQRLVVDTTKGNRKQKLKRRVRIERAILRPPPRDLPTQPPKEFFHPPRPIVARAALWTPPLLIAPSFSFILLF